MERIKCECGIKVYEKNLNRHLKSKIHLKKIKQFEDCLVDMRSRIHPSLVEKYDDLIGDSGKLKEEIKRKEGINELYEHLKKEDEEDIVVENKTDYLLVRCDTFYDDSEGWWIKVDRNFKGLLKYLEERTSSGWGIDAKRLRQYGNYGIIKI